MLHTPFYDPKKTYYENFDEGPFGAFADGKAFSDSGEPHFEIFGRKIHAPIGIPAGPLLNGRFIQAALDKGFDIPMQKTVRTRRKACHQWPNVLGLAIDGDLTLEKAGTKLRAKPEYTEPLSITNSFGNPSYNPDFWQPDIHDAVLHARQGQIVAASFEGTRWEGFDEKNYINDWVTAARLLKETGVHFVEANLSCPNEGTVALLCYDSGRVLAIAEAIKNEIGNFPFVLKISYFESTEALRELVREVGGVVDGFSAINTISAEVVDEQGNQVLPGEGRLRSGVCGRAIRWAGLDMVRRLKDLREAFGFSFRIIGVGGVTTAKDFFEYREAGADAVMSATGAMWNPHLAQEIKQELCAQA